MMSFVSLLALLGLQREPAWHSKLRLSCKPRTGFEFRRPTKTNRRTLP